MSRAVGARRVMELRSGYGYSAYWFALNDPGSPPNSRIIARNPCACGDVVVAIDGQRAHCRPTAHDARRRDARNAGLGSTDGKGSRARSDAIGPESADISGVWTGDPGISYVIQQSGTVVVFTEQGAYGPTAIGYGTIVGARFTFQFEAVNGSSGTGELTLRSDGSLAGSFTSYQGPSAALRLTR